MTGTAGLRLDIPEGHQPIRVRATLRTGIGYDPPYGLDLAGLLATRLRSIQQATLEETGNLARTPLPDTTEEDPGDMDLPLSRCLTGPDWHWLASCAIPVDPDEFPEPRTFYRTVDTSWAQRAATRPLAYFHPSKGPYRDVMMPAAVVLCREVVWHAVGDPDAVHRLLAPLRFIGRRRSNGEGGVLAWHVEPIEADPARWTHEHDGQIIRPCPHACADQLNVPYTEGWYALRPPSWHPDRLQKLAMTASTEEDW